MAEWGAHRSHFRSKVRWSANPTWNSFLRGRKNCDRNCFADNCFGKQFILIEHEYCTRTVALCITIFYIIFQSYLNLFPIIFKPFGAGGFKRYPSKHIIIRCSPELGAPQLTGWCVMRVGKRHVPRKKKYPWSVAHKEQSYDLRVTECPGIKRSLGTDHRKGNGDVKSVAWLAQYFLSSFRKIATVLFWRQLLDELQSASPMKEETNKVECNHGRLLPSFHCYI